MRSPSPSGRKGGSAPTRLSRRRRQAGASSIWGRASCGSRRRRSPWPAGLPWEGDEGTGMTKLSVNVNKVATLRNTRTNAIPSVAHAARLALEAGAHGITVHPRPDQRHIRPHDVFEIAELLKQFSHAEFNIEGNPFHDYLEFAAKVRPTQCTLFPDSPEAFTSNHGRDLRAE